MINRNDELLHEAKASTEWEESYTLHFCDRKASLYGYVELGYCPKKKEVRSLWSLHSAAEHFDCEKVQEAEVKPGASAIKTSTVKYEYEVKGGTPHLVVKNPDLDCELTLGGGFHAYDFPLAAAVNIDPRQEHFESVMWKRYAQRVRVAGKIHFKKGARKGQSVNIDCCGFRDHLWGDRLWKDVAAVSRCSMQFREMGLYLTCADFGGVGVSNGYICRKSGNIPIPKIELEYIEIREKNTKFRSSEMSFRDSQDDHDLIVSTVLQPMEVAEIKHGRRRFLRIRAFSVFSIIGAGKKGTGFEEHIILADSLGEYTSVK
jgi:hypothetical protein